MLVFIFTEKHTLFLLEFSDTIIGWIIRTLLTFKKYSHSTLDISIFIVTESPKAMNELLDREQIAAPPNYKSWVRKTKKTTPKKQRKKQRKKFKQTLTILINKIY